MNLETYLLKLSDTLCEIHACSLLQFVLQNTLCKFPLMKSITSTVLPLFMVFFYAMTLMSDKI